MPRTCLVGFGLASLFAGGNIAAQAAATAAVAVEQLMSAKQFEAAGLRKLSVEELTALNEWLRDYSRALIQGATASLLPQGSEIGSTPSVIESRIDGEFSGWEGETIFKLLNGQIWQQASYSYKYHYAYGPKVLIYKSGALYKMKVDGVDGEITVRRLK